MENYIAAFCWNCETKFVNATGVGEPLTEDFMKRVKVNDRDGEWFRCPVCRYEDGLDMRTVEDGWLQNIWLIKTELIRCGDGEVRPVTNWQRYHSFTNAVNELKHLEAHDLSLKEGQVATVWEAFERPKVLDENIQTIRNA